MKVTLLVGVLVLGGSTAAQADQPPCCVYRWVPQQRTRTEYRTVYEIVNVNGHLRRIAKVVPVTVQYTVKVWVKVCDPPI